MNNIEDITVEIHQKYSLNVVNSLFSELRNCMASLPIFLSEQWFTAWLSVTECSPNLVTFKHDGKLVGFVFLGKKSNWYGDIYYLNQIGDVQFDQMWIEHNNIICHPKFLSACQKILLQKLSQTKRFHRLVVSLTSTGNWETQSTFIWSKERHKVHYFDMKLINKNDHSMSTLLSKNTRSSINRAANYIIKQYGDINIHIPQDKHALLNEKIAPLHKKQWQDSSSGSGFSNPRFVKFHEDLCSQDSQNFRTEILEIAAGQHVLGYLYMMLSHKTVYFYLSAINYNNDDNRYKPGMVMHKYAIEHYAGMDFDSYDFLAGDARYKSSLSSAHYPLYTVHIANSTWQHRALYTLNTAVKKLSRLTRADNN